jgi:uncharacterized lipoprotein YddW (UPF0748 family)
MINNIKNNNFNSIILQVRDNCNAIYESNIFPRDYNFDVLDYFIKESHKNNISVVAWINPYRVRTTSNIDSIKDINFINKDYLYINNGIYLNPSKREVEDLIVNGVKEVLNYDIDGVLFDDYFYPSSDIDLDNYSLYKSSGGILSLSEYRLENISEMIYNVNSSIKKIDDSVLFGIAPQGNIDNNYSSVFLDVKKILSNSGYIDYIMPQIYFGFENSSKPFAATIEEWSSLIKIPSISLIPALSLYKSGSVDKYAGNGSDEWIDNSDILKRQIIYSRGISNYFGFSIFRYDFFYNKDKQNANMVSEVNNIKSVINFIILINFNISSIWVKCTSRTIFICQRSNTFNIV